MTKKEIILIIVLLFAMHSCVYNSSTKLESNDTTNILYEVFESKSFLKDNIERDKIFIIKSKFFNNNYPKKTKYFDLEYIEDTPMNKVFNHPYKQKDKRLRLDITAFNYKKDTVIFSMVDCGVSMDYLFKLTKKNKKWGIIEEKINMY